LRIKEKRTAVLCPVIDFISAESMAYSGGSGVSSVGGFWWSLHFKWDGIPQRELLRRKSETDPVK
jgi:polypeptide N-acetylgalactosaminyltransferase